MSRDNHRL